MTAYMKESPISARAVTLVQKNATEITGQKKKHLKNNCRTKQNKDSSIRNSLEEVKIE